eukprot:505342_1
MNGHGKITYSNGSTYEGEWKDDKYHGNEKWTDKTSYFGFVKNGKKHGHGKMVWKSGEWAGDCYEGSWKNGGLVIRGMDMVNICIRERGMDMVNICIRVVIVMKDYGEMETNMDMVNLCGRVNLGLEKFMKVIG